MFALGAIACAHSTSSEVSTAHDQPGPAGSVPGSVVPPVSLTTVSAGSGRENCWSKECRSETMSGALYASTMAMVWPVPSPVTPLKMI